MMNRERIKTSRALKEAQAHFVQALENWPQYEVDLMLKLDRLMAVCTKERFNPAHLSFKLKKHQQGTVFKEALTGAILYLVNPVRHFPSLLLKKKLAMTLDAASIEQASKCIQTVQLQRKLLAKAWELGLKSDQYLQHEYLTKRPDASLLTHYVDHQDLEGLEFLVSQNISMIEPPKDSVALHLACSKNNPFIADFLIKHGVDINQRDALGQTALFVAVETHQKVMVEYLIHHGADVNLQTHSGVSPLMNAIKSRQKNLVQILMQHQADIQAIGERGDTPLHYAAFSGSVGVSQMLIEGGADIEAKNHRGETAYESLKNLTYYPKVLAYLEEVRLAALERKELQLLIKPSLRDGEEVPISPARFSL